MIVATDQQDEGGEGGHVSLRKDCGWLAMTVFAEVLDLSTSMWTLMYWSSTVGLNIVAESDRPARRRRPWPPTSGRVVRSSPSRHLRRRTLNRIGGRLFFFFFSFLWRRRAARVGQSRVEDGQRRRRRVLIEATIPAPCGFPFSNRMHRVAIGFCCWLLRNHGDSVVKVMARFRLETPGKSENELSALIEPH